MVITRQSDTCSWLTRFRFCARCKMYQNKKRGRPLKDLIPKKNTQPKQKSPHRQSFGNSFPVITITMLISKATAICWHFKIIDIQFKFLKFNIVFNSTFIIFLQYMRSSQVLFLISLLTFRWLKGGNNTRKHWYFWGDSIGISLRHAIFKNREEGW